MTSAEWAEIEVEATRTKDEWTLKFRLLPVPMEGPLEEEEEQQYDTEIETASESLRPLEQSPAPSAEDLGSSGKETSDIPAM